MLLAVGSLLVNFLLIYVAFSFVRPEERSNHKPRAAVATLEGRSFRAWSAHQNQIEIFAPFAAAVLCALFAGADPTWVGELAVVFTLLRVIYLGLYLNDLPSLRSACWALGFLCILILFGLSLTRLIRGV